MTSEQWRAQQWQDQQWQDQQWQDQQRTQPFRQWPPAPPQPTATPGRNTVAVVAFGLGVLALVSLSMGTRILPVALGVAALVTGAVGHGASRRSGRGMRFALAGLLFGLLSLVIALAG